jgi:acyl-CoA dehydrogenase
MHFDLEEQVNPDTAEQAEWRQKVRDFMERDFVPYIDDWEEEAEQTGVLSREAYRRLCQFGFSTFDLPKEQGGMELSRDLIRIAYEELERACHWEHVEVPFMLGIGRGLVYEALEVGDQELVEAAIRGDQSIAHVVTEYKGGSDYAFCETTAVRDGDHYVLNGAKDLISCVPGHQWLRTIVQTDPEAYESGDRHHALTVLLINTAWPGVTIKPVRTPDLKAWHSLATVEFDNTIVPVQYRLGDENDGYYRIQRGFAMRGVGGSVEGDRFQEMAEEAADRARTRDMLGRPQLAHPSIQAKLIDAYALSELLKVAGWYTSWLANLGDRPRGGAWGARETEGRVSREELSGWGAMRTVASKEWGHQVRMALMDIWGDEVASARHPMLKSYIAHMSQKARGGGVETHKFRIGRSYYGKEFDSRT